MANRYRKSTTRPLVAAVIGRAVAMAVAVPWGCSSAFAQTPQAATRPLKSAAAPAAATPQPAPTTPSTVASPAALSPAPSPLAADIAFFSRMDQAIAPARDATPSPDDVQRLRDLAKALGGSDQTRIRAAIDATSSPLTRKLALWLRLRSGFGEPAEFKAFVAANPDWPDRALLVQRMEDALFTQGGSAATIREIFAATAPATGAGHAALASAHLAEGNTAKAKEHAGKAWRELRIPVLLETGFLDRFKSLLEPADHKWRLDRLLVDDVRWNNDKAERAAVVRRLIPLLPEGIERQKAEARLAVFMKAPNAAALMAAIPPEANKGDWGFTYHRIQLLRRQNQDAEAKRLMLSAPLEARELVSPDDWWTERRANAYSALENKNPRLAYDLVKDVGPLSVNPAKEQTFMAGWLALRYLNDAKSAEGHFQAMAKIADGPLSRAKASYWLGRTREAAGDIAGSRPHYQASSRFVDTFHGQLSRAKLTPGDRRLTLGLPAEPTSAEVERFRNHDVVRAAVVAWKSGLDSAVVRAMLGHLARSVMTSEAETAMVAHLAEAFKDTQAAVRIAKSGIARGQNLIVYGYPTHPFPSYTPLRAPPEMAFLLGIARQESEFNTLTVSGAGARGLLQVMPITAKHVCTDYKLKCDIPRLLSDRSYNTMMASAYIGDRMNEFSGSYVLGLAGYNAGPGRARQWIRQFGDPRSTSIDPIDWIERIPFQETREYVAKVLANVQIYRARLGDEANALRVAEDLARARTANLAVEPRSTPASAGGAVEPAPEKKPGDGDLFKGP